MISISKTQNKNLAFTRVSSFSSKNSYIQYLCNDPSINVPKSLIELIMCFDNIERRSNGYFLSVAFDSNKNKLYIGKHDCYSKRVYLLELDIKSMTEESLGYSITAKGANWTGTVKKLNDFHGTEYAKMTEDKSTLIIDKTDHTEFKTLLQIIARLNNTINMCEHNGLNNHDDYTKCLECYATTQHYTINKDIRKIITHAREEALKYLTSIFVKTKFIEDIAKCVINRYIDQFRYINYTDNNNFELSYSARFQISKTGLASGLAAPYATIVVKYRVVKGKASWKVFDNDTYNGVWSYDSDHTYKISNDFSIEIHDNRNSSNSVETKGYLNFLKLALARSSEFRKVRDVLVKAFKL